MRPISSTLLAAQRSSNRIPHVSVTVSNKVSGVVRLDWERLYTGSESEYRHSASIAGDGSLVRIRVTGPENGQHLYRQRVVSPGIGSAFCSWTDTAFYSVMAVPCCARNAEVYIFFIDSDRKLRYLKSGDYGVTWGAPVLIDYVSSTAVYGMAAGYKQDGSPGLFYIEQTTLYVKQCVSGTWQSPGAWDKSTGDLSGVACWFDRDWNLLVTGKDTGGNTKLWSLVYGNGGDVASGTWSPLQEMASAPAGENYEFLNPCLDKPDTFRCFYVEKFTGSTAYCRLFWSHSVLGTGWVDNLCREPVPFDFDGECCPALVHDNNYAWLCGASGIWRAPLSVLTLHLTTDVINLKEELAAASGNLTVELDNTTLRYAFPGMASLSVLAPGYQVEFSPGCHTSAGNETGAGRTYSLEAFEHVTGSGKSNLILYAFDGWAALKQWNARCQFRWNLDSNALNVKQILEFVLARVGIKLVVRSQSPVISTFYPDFTIQPGTSGDTVVLRLLSFVSDMVFIEGNTGYLINPLAAGSPVYSYGNAHSIVEGKYRNSLLGFNRVQVEGYDTESGAAIVADSFNWCQIDMASDRFYWIIDRNIGSVETAQSRGEACLRKADIESSGGYIRVPVNCGQQLYDVIDITCPSAGLVSANRRVIGITTIFNPVRGIYEQKLSLGNV